MPGQMPRASGTRVAASTHPKPHRGHPTDQCPSGPVLQSGVMKAVILAGGSGTRLRPLTLELPKPIVPIFDRPFLYYQTDLLRQVPEIDEVILSLNYHPDRIEARVGDGTEAGLPVRYVVEPDPLGTGGAIKYASVGIDDTLLVFNGDVLTGIDLQSVVRRHREREARATIVLTPVDDPSAYGLVETDDDGNVHRFLEKPSPDQITCNTINAASTSSNRRRSTASRTTLSGRSSGSTFPRWSSGARPLWPMSIGGIGSTSAHRGATSAHTAT